MGFQGLNDHNDTSMLMKCNCYLIEGTPQMCFQSREFIRAAESEAWAYFYSTSLFNERETNCSFAYWHEMYDGEDPFDAELDHYPPVTVDCADMPKWQYNLCPADDKGVLQDWLGFYWNVWANGDYKYTINELSDVYSRPEVSSDMLWSELVSAVNAKYPSNQEKRNQFINMGGFAGVNY